MRKFSICILFTLISFSVQATECVGRIFSESHINLYLCQNYSNYKEIRTLLFEARAKVLNDYILNKIENSLLEDKKFEIQIYDAALTSPHLEVTQGENGYFINVSGFPNLEKILAIVDCFSKPDWKSFIVGYEPNINSDITMDKIADFYKVNARKKSPIMQQNPFAVWSQDDLQLRYFNDNLSYYVNNIPLAIEAASSLPVKIKDRFLLFQHDMIFVLEGEKIIKKLQVDKPISEDYDIYPYNTWINICIAGEQNWLYSYSYRENKFYARP